MEGLLSTGPTPSSYLMTTSVSALHYMCSPSGWVISQTQDETVLMYQQQFLLPEPGMSLGQVPDIQYDYPMNTSV